MKTTKSVSQVFTEKMLDEMGIKPALNKNLGTFQEINSFQEIDNWMEHEGFPGLVLAGEAGAKRTALMRGIAKAIIDINKGLYRGFTLRKDLRQTRVIGRTATDIVSIAHNSGRNGLFGEGSALLSPCVLLIDNMGAPYEEAEIVYQGWDSTRASFVTERIFPVVEVIIGRLSKGYPTIFSTLLDADEIRRKYGQCGAYLLNGIAEYCRFVWVNNL